MAGNLFFGISLNNHALQTSLLETTEEFAPRVPRATWTSRDKLHLTLVFLGKVPPETASDMLVNACRGKQPFSLSVKGAGYFVNRQGPRVLWADVTAKDKLRALHRCLGGTQSFNPHLTLAKLETSGDYAPQFAEIARLLAGNDFGSTLVESVKLYRTAGNGQPYELVAEHRLA